MTHREVLEMKRLEDSLVTAAKAFNEAMDAYKAFRGPIRELSAVMDDDEILVVRKVTILT